MLRYDFPLDTFDVHLYDLPCMNQPASCAAWLHASIFINTRSMETRAWAIYAPSPYFHPFLIMHS